MHNNIILMLFNPILKFFLVKGVQNSNYFLKGLKLLSSKGLKPAKDSNQQRTQTSKGLKPAKDSNQQRTQTSKGLKLLSETSFLKGLKDLRSLLINFSSSDNHLCEWDDDFFSILTWLSNASTTLLTPRDALLALLIAFSVLFAPIDFISV